MRVCTGQRAQVHIHTQRYIYTRGLFSCAEGRAGGRRGPRRSAAQVSTPRGHFHQSASFLSLLGFFCAFRTSLSAISRRCCRPFLALALICSLLNDARCKVVALLEHCNRCRNNNSRVRDVITSDRRVLTRVCRELIRCVDCCALDIVCFGVCIARNRRTS